MSKLVPTASFFALQEGIIFTGEAMIEGHAVLIQNGKIVDIVVNRKVPVHADKIPCPQRILAPGYIDIQVNGGGNILLNDLPTVDSCRAIAKAHEKYGTTRLLLTCLTDKPGVAAQALAALRQASMHTPNILGLHFEGPHLSLQKRGVHKADYIRTIEAVDLELYQPRDNEILLVTVAPENVKDDIIRKLVQRGVFVSLGHTDADSEQIRNALLAGATGFTHLFNGMGVMSARHPGVAGVALDDKASWCGLIVDKHHVSPEMVRLATRAKETGKIMLVSDAMPPAASAEPKVFALYGEPIHVEEQCCRTSTGCLAGSAITLSDAVKNCIELGIDVEESLRMASLYPAAFLGLDQRFGKILPTYSADIVALDYKFNPQQVWIEGCSDTK